MIFLNTISQSTSPANHYVLVTPLALFCWMPSLKIVERRKTERALRASEERFRLIFEKSKAIKLLIDPKSGNIVDSNQTACDFYGYPMERMKSGRVID